MREAAFFVVSGMLNPYLKSPLVEKIGEPQSKHLSAAYMGTTNTNPL